jgi:hypothetical protein
MAERTTPHENDESIGQHSKANLDTLEITKGTQSRYQWIFKVVDPFDQDPGFHPFKTGKGTRIELPQSILEKQRGSMLLCENAKEVVCEMERICNLHSGEERGQLWIYRFNRNDLLLRYPYSFQDITNAEGKKETRFFGERITYHCVDGIVEMVKGQADQKRVIMTKVFE